MVDYIEKILNSPDGLNQLKVLNEAFKKEQEKRHEFREWVTPEIKAEFINGEILLHSPVKKKHWSSSDLLSTLLSFYVRSKKIGKVGVEKVMISLSRNDYEPDIVFFANEKSDKFSDEQLLFPAPDFVVEILSKSTAHNDKGIKKIDYALHGIKEYWIIDPDKECLYQHYLLHDDDKEYFPHKTYYIDDIIESRVIRGFNIPIAAIFNDEANLLAMKTLV